MFRIERRVISSNAGVMSLTDETVTNRRKGRGEDKVGQERLRLLRALRVRRLLRGEHRRSVSRNIWFTSSVCMPCTCANTPANCRRHTAKNAGFFAHRLYTATPRGPSTFFTSSKKPFYTSTTTAAPTLKNGIGGNDVFSPGSFASMSTNR